MFSRPERLQQRTPKNGVGRYDYLKQLVNEFKTTNSVAAKEQVLANLANFSYDPINYDFLRSLQIINLFLDQLSETNPRLVQFAAAGICNLITDPENQEYILKSGGVNNVADCLTSSDEQTVLSAITTLIFLLQSSTKSEIIKNDIVKRIKPLSNSTNKRFKNLADIFLQNCDSSLEKK